MSKLLIELKQHTPIIQFQGEQKDAVLRGTEIKPKLDKFLIKHEFKNDFQKYEKFLIGYKSENEKDYKDKKALNYKLRVKVRSEGKPIDIGYNRYPFYFNDINSSDTNKFILYTNKIDCRKSFGKKVVKNIKGKIYIEVFSLHAELIEAIKTWIPKFFIINNFGFRQNKGYGSFTVEKINSKNISINNPINLISEMYPDKGIYYIEYNGANWKRIMDDCTIIYQIMKSGINFGGNYEKSFLFRYLKGKEIGNEKRFIKEKFFGIKEDANDKCQRYVRAVLGVCKENIYRNISDDSNSRKNKKDITKIYYKTNEENESLNVERYSSPIFFKIIGNRLFIFSKEIYYKSVEYKKSESIYNKSFMLSDKKINMTKDKKKEDENIYYIETLSEDQFNMEDFLKEYFKYFNTMITIRNDKDNFRNKYKLNIPKDKVIELGRVKDE